MAALTTYNKTDTTLREYTSTSPVEVTEYTVAWSDLTSAGFANGDDVIYIIRCMLGGDNIGRNDLSDFLIGSTFAGAVSQTSYLTEPNSAAAGRGFREFMYLDRITLATNNNFYTSLSQTTGGTARIQDFTILVLKLDDLSADDFRYAEDTSTGNAPDIGSEADGASVTLPSGGGDDWLVVATADWLIDSTSTNFRQLLSLGGSAVMAQEGEGEDTSEKFSRGCVGYLAAAAASAVCKLQYAAEGGASHDYIRSAIFALRMEAFESHAGIMDADVVAVGTTPDTYVETNSISLSLSATRNVIFFAQTIADIVSTSDESYHRVQENNTDIISGLGRQSHTSYDPTDQHPLTSFGIGSMTSGTKTIDVDCAEDLHPVPAVDYNFDEHTLVAFTTELFSVGGNSQSVTATATGAAIILRRLSAFRLLDPVAVVTPKFSKSMSTSYLAQSAGVPKFTKRTQKTLPSSSAGVAVINAILAALSFFQSLIATVVSVPSIFRISSYNESLTPTATIVPLFKRQTAKIMTDTAVVTPLVSRETGHIMNVTATGTPLFARFVSHIMALVGTGVVTINTLLAFGKDLSVVVTGVVTLSRITSYFQTLAHIVVAPVKFVRHTGKILVAISSVVPSLGFPSGAVATVIRSWYKGLFRGLGKKGRGG